MSPEKPALAPGEPPPFAGERAPRIAGCWICFPRGLSGTGEAGDPAWTAAVVRQGNRLLGQAERPAEADAHYRPGLLALREGPALSGVVRALSTPPDVLLVNATGRDHPRGAGLALHLGAVLGIPTVGITHRPLLAVGDRPADEHGARTPLYREGERVGFWVTTRPGTRPLAVDAAWRTTAEVAVEVALLACAGHRTPEPLRHARHLARRARATSSAAGTTGQSS